MTVDAQKQALTAQLQAAFSRSDALFDMIPPDQLLSRPIGLRHPILFYLGHLPAFAWNQVGRGALEEGHLDAHLDCLFERGIDPDDERCAAEQSIHAWPDLAEVYAYRDRARQAVLSRLDEVFSRAEDPLCEAGRVFHLVIEHELMHHETLLYIFAEAPPGLVQRPDHIPDPPSGEGRRAAPVHIPGGAVRLGVDWDDQDFGWDNEFGALTEEIPAFTLDSLPVRNRDWLDFYRSQGAPPSLFPQSWVREGAQLSVKTVFGPVAFEAAEGWPVQVSGAQARAYCAHQGGRLPTEAELQRAAYHTPSGELRPYPWGDAPPTAERGTFGFNHHAPTPVGSSPAGASAWGVEELVGNGWEWTQTPFTPLPGFRAWARSYPGYSADFFDGEHDVVFGASWATDPKLMRASFRNWYRRNYPYPFSSFRVARGA